MSINSMYMFNKSPGIHHFRKKHIVASTFKHGGGSVIVLGAAELPQNSWFIIQP